jgi:uncharacterized damage-inducible protein DinB
MAAIHEFIAGWMSHRQALLNLVEKLQDQHLSYKPWEKGMTLSELVFHIVNSTDMFVQIVKNGAFTPSSEQKPAQTAGELKAIALSVTDRTKAALESITDEQLSNIAEFNGMKMPGIAMLQMAKEHEIHHKGQLFTYARAAGLEDLPFFISR